MAFKRKQTKIVTFDKLLRIQLPDTEIDSAQQYTHPPHNVNHHLDQCAWQRNALSKIRFEIIGNQN